MTMSASDTAGQSMVKAQNVALRAPWGRMAFVMGNNAVSGEFQKSGPPETGLFVRKRGIRSKHGSPDSRIAVIPESSTMPLSPAHIFRIISGLD